MDSNIKLKGVDTRTLEAAIEKIVTEATGWDYTCTIKEIQYLDLGDSQLTLILRTSDWLKQPTSIETEASAESPA
jgi:hypothetical protein